MLPIDVAAVTRTQNLSAAGHQVYIEKVKYKLNSSVIN